MEASVFFISIFSFCFFLSSFHLSLSQPSDSEYYRECQPQPCGKVGNISYPFLSQSQPNYCGSSPEFKLNCPQNEQDFPSIQIDSQAFNVTHIDNSTNRMNLVLPKDYDNCSSHVSNTSVNIRSNLFHYDDEKNVTLFYDCPLSYSNGGMKIPCLPPTIIANSNPSIFAAYLDDPIFPELMKNCEHHMGVPVPTEIEENTEAHSKALEDALGKGFSVRYDFDESCGKCLNSHGICGSNETFPFTCYCLDGQYPIHCPYSPVPSDSSGVVTAVVVALVMLILFYFYQRRKKIGYAKSYIQSRTASSVSSKLVDSEINASKYFGVPLFTYTELEEATNNFHEARELGDGGFGTVYYGRLKDGREVAVKRLYENNYKRVEQFINEIQILTRLRHVNLVSLYGCTSRHSRELLLVYEYIPNGTVADHLHGDRAKPGSLPWNIRMNIAIETASALTYLHASDIIHRDVKTNNILLDKHFVVKVADFGLSRLFPDHVTHISTAPQGTPGYVDPEYHECYKLTDKSDVFSFGVVLIELISSLPAVDITRHRHEINLSTMAINKIQHGALHELVDPTLGFESDPKVRKMINAVAELAFRCLQNFKDDRPSMEEVVETLRELESDGKHKSEPEVMDICAKDDIGLLKNDIPPPSPDSNLASKSTTSNSSS